MKPPLPRLVLITDFSRGDRALLEALEQALSAGRGLAVQHREPGASAQRQVELGLELQARCDAAGALFFASGRLDVALALGCHLHLPAAALGPAQVRAALPADRLISCSVHDADEARAAAGADLALVSPVWPAGSKPSDSRAPLGIDGFATLARALPCPAFALGGVTPERLAALKPRGAAAISSWLTAADPAAATRKLLLALPNLP